VIDLTQGIYCTEEESFLKKATTAQCVMTILMKP
jgi:hypothetical protein